MKTKQSYLTKIITIIILSLLIIYIGGLLYFKNTFLFNTSINNLDVSHLTTDEVHKQFNKNITSQNISLNFSDGQHVTITKKQCGITYNPHNNLQQLLDQQNYWLWFTSFFKKQELSLDDALIINQDILNQTINSLKHIQNQIPPKNAYIDYINNEFIIIKEELGSTIDTAKLSALIQNAILSKEEAIDLTKKQAYIKPSILSKDQKLQDSLKQVKTYCDAHITYQTNKGTISLNPKELLTWLKNDQDIYYYDEQYYQTKAKEFIQQLASKINNIKTTKTYTLANNRQVSVYGGNYGLKLNEAKEKEALINDILAHKNTTRKPITTGIQVSTLNNGIGHTFVEIDLTAQKVYLVKDHQLIIESDCVTGKHIDPSRRTPQGTYYLYAKQQNRILRGSKKPNGKYEYESHVNYWMPFNRGIGLHDASWRNKFGGDIYINSGSHGCINLPNHVAKTIYFNIKINTPVIVHY